MGDAYKEGAHLESKGGRGLELGRQQKVVGLRGASRGVPPGAPEEQVDLRVGPLQAGEVHGVHKLYRGKEDGGNGAVLECLGEVRSKRVGAAPRTGGRFGGPTGSPGAAG